MPLTKKCCLTPLIIPGTPRGSYDYHDKQEKQIKWYHTRPSDTSVSQGKDTAIVLFYDVFGFNLPNPKILADEFADKLGVDVYVPNYLPQPPSIEPFLAITDLVPHEQALKGLTKWKRWILTGWAYLQSLPYLIKVLDWFAYTRAKKLLAQIQVDKKLKHVGIIGYCRGGAIVIRLLSEQVAPVDCGVICHPGPTKSKEWKTIVKPSSWHLADQDDFMKDDQIAALVQLSEAKAKESVIMQHKLHPETTHGFASRPNENHGPSKAAYIEVKETAASFFRAHLGAVPL